jgi:thiamine biosynthesis protein ThiI
MEEIIILKLGEIVLKGLNRRVFEDTLLKNIKRRISRNHEYDIESAQSTVYVIPRDKDQDLDEAMAAVSKIFGIVSYQKACRAPKDLPEIEKTACSYLDDQLREAKTFKVECKRSDKKFPYKSPEIAAEVGAYILGKYSNLSVDVHEPEVIVWIEIREDSAFIHGNPKKGAGGIPVGTGGKAAVLISGGIDSPVAAYMMARRGVELTAVHFCSPPYTSDRALEKVKTLLREVGAYAGRITLYTVHFTEVQEQIRDRCPEDYGTILVRRYMMRIAEKIARSEECLALITGESLGQVASQTMQAISCTNEVCTMPVFRPLIGTDKSEIVEMARKIGTFDTSIEPYEDCCTVFTPKHPRTRPDMHFVLDAEKNLDTEKLVNDCVEKAEKEIIRFYGGSGK